MSQTATTLTQEYRTKLRQNLIKYFDDTELRDLCFDMEVDYQCLPGESKADKARELITYLEHRSRIPELIKRCKELRPNVAWNAEGEMVTLPLPRPVPGCKMQARLIIIVAAVGLVGIVVAASVQSYLSGNSLVEASRIALANLTGTPSPTMFIALTPTALSITSAPFVTPRPTFLPTRTAIVAATTTTSTGRMWQNWTQVQSFPAPAAKPSFIVRQGDVLWVAAGSQLYQLSLEGDIISEIESPGSCANAAWDGEMLWCGSASSVYRRGITSGQQLVSFTVDIDPIVGLAWNEEALWVIDQDGNLARYDKTGQRLQRLAVSARGSEILDLMWVEGEFWLIDIFTDVTRLDSKFNHVDWFPLCGASFPYHAVTFWDGNNLWVADSNTNRISQCTPGN